MTYNVDLMLQVREQITAHPETHNQDHFERGESCGTTRCIAGWAVAIHHCLTNKSIYDDKALQQRTHNDTPDEAAHLMGLNYDEAHNLFYEFDEERALKKLDALIEKGKNQC